MTKLSHPWRGEGHPARPIILPRTDVQRIANGRKTQLRRLARPEPLTGRLQPCGLKVGSSYDIQRGILDDDPAARIVITAVVAQKLTDITTDSARAEGYHDKYDRGDLNSGIRARAMFAADWMLKHDRHWPLLEEAPCDACDGFAEIDGERCTAGCDELGITMIPARFTDEQILRIFEARHARRWVWVVTFELAQHLYLHKLSHRGYTANHSEALIDAGEVLGEPSDSWRQRARERQLEALRDRDGARLAGLRTDEERLSELLAIAAENGIDVGRHKKVIRHRLDAIEREITDKREGRAA